MLTLNLRGNMNVTDFGDIDKLIMRYQGNQLTKVDDAATDPTLSTAISMDFRSGTNAIVQYYYDTNGNLTKDLNKGISDIQYNSLNLPDKLVISDAMGTATNTYLYSADGRKLNVTSRWGTSSSKNTDYVGNMIYENGSLKRILVSSGYIEGGLYYFYLTDHLGNKRMVAKADGTVVQSNHYYPFGMSFADGVSISSQPFKFGNKELDTDRGLNWYDFSARYKTVGLPPFTTMDPLAEKYYAISPYAYCANNPLKFIDPTGMELLLFKNGTYIGSHDDGKEEVTGFNQRSTINKDGAEEFTGADNFSFNDIELDREALEKGDMTLSFMSQSNINNIINISGVKEQNVISRWGYAARESNASNLDGSGKMDYKLYLPGNLNKTMYVINSVGYNGPDAGNYLWGYGMGIMGFTSVTARAAAHANAWWSAKESNGERSYNPNTLKRWFEDRSWTGDSYADQRAIQNGLNDSGSYWTAKKRSIRKLWK